MDRITDENRRRNAITRDGWDEFAPHREKVTGLLEAACRSPNDRLCVLGAGNCNDLDLARLAESFGEVHLVDLDGESLAAGVARQQMTQRDKLRLHGGVDVTGIGPLLGKWSPDAGPGEGEAGECVELARRAALPHLPGPFQVVASACLLTQLIDGAVLTVGERHPRFLDLIFAIRWRHLQLLLDLAAPAGRAILVTDFVSSDTVPELGDIPGVDFAGRLAELIRQRNFFTGTNPFVLRSVFQTDPMIAPFVAEVRLLRPWRWRLRTRVYAVCALEVQRKADGPV
jgi:hypothetical protein